MPVTRFQIRTGHDRRRDHRPARAGRSAVGGDSLLERGRRRPRRGRAAQDRAASTTGRSRAGCSRRRSATSTSRRGPSSCTPTSSPACVDLDAIRDRRFKLVLDYAFGTASFVMPNVLAKLGADVLVINPNVSTSGVHRLRPGRARRPARRSRPLLGRPPRGDARSRRRAADPRGRHRLRARRRRGAARARPARLDRRARGTDRRARGRQPARSRRCAPRRARR